jgi:cell division protein FtsL
MALTVGGFAQVRSGVLRGTGGNRERRDNGVPPPPLVDEPDSTDWSSAAIAAPTWPKTRPARRRTVHHAGRRRAAWRKASRALPAALEWRDARLPLLGRLWARAWLPSILLAGCLVALVYLLQTSGVATTGYDIQRLQAERDDWQLRNEQLQLELAKRQSLTWIESEATGRLGMVRPDPTTVSYVKSGR